MTLPKIPAWEVVPFVEQTKNGYRFGNTYSNLLVLWLDLADMEAQNYARLPLADLIPRL